MSHILIISRYYPPEVAVEGVCVSEIARRLVKSGHQVTVLTTMPNYPTGIVPPEYRGHMVQSEECDGIHILRVWCYITPNRGFVLRILAQLSFGCMAPLLGWKKVGRPDIILVSSPPLFNVIAGRILAWLKQRPLVVRIADLWPESAVKLGVLRNQLLIRLAEWLEWSTYQRASFVWVVTAGIRDTLIQRGLSPEAIFLSTNGVDTVKFHPASRMQARAELGWDDRFTVLYAGNHGLVYDMMSILDAAEHLRDNADIHIILVGDGVKKAELVEQARARNLRNITFLDPVPHDHVPLLVAAADVCLAPLRKMLFLKGSLPVKMFEVMASARPLILAAEGLARHLAEESGAVMCVEPENSTELVSAILHLRNHPALAEELGQRGRAFVETRFDYDQLTSALEARIAPLLGQKAHTSVTVSSTEINASLIRGMHK